MKTKNIMLGPEAALIYLIKKRQEKMNRLDKVISVVIIVIAIAFFASGIADIFLR